VASVAVCDQLVYLGPVRIRGRIVPPAAVLVAAALVCVSCFPEPPVRETLLLRFTETGFLEVFASTWIHGGKDASPPVAQRVGAAREAALRGEDLWARAFHMLSPSEERVTFEWEKGELRHVERAAVLEDPEAVKGLFSEVSLSAFVVTSGRERTLEIHPARTLRASLRQQRTVQEALDRFAGKTSEYLRATALVWHYVDEHPERAKDILAHVFADRLAEKEIERYPVSEKEAELAKSLAEAMSELMSVFQVAPDEAYTLDELSRLVYDPLLATLSVEVPGPVTEFTAFRHAKGNLWLAPSVGLWGALTALRERWVSPEPILVLVDLEGRPLQGPLDVAAYSALPKKVRSVPGADEVRAALVAGLAPPEVYMLRWRVPAARKQQVPEEPRRPE
jgi:hypothetical protein